MVLMGIAMVIVGIVLIIFGLSILAKGNYDLVGRFPFVVKDADPSKWDQFIKVVGKVSVVGGAIVFILGIISLLIKLIEVVLTLFLICVVGIAIGIIVIRIKARLKARQLKGDQLEQ
ncbi:MAG: hypothetical protein ACOYCB_09490 [Fastidiosipilaceae bacterium]|jgi:hypothetical protein|nr:hypothetical protein [Clostridiaceae bacterium]